MLTIWVMMQKNKFFFQIKKKIGGKMSAQTLITMSAQTPITMSADIPKVGADNKYNT